jgi:hypothetical protein
MGNKVSGNGWLLLMLHEFDWCNSLLSLNLVMCCDMDNNWTLLYTPHVHTESVCLFVLVYGHRWGKAFNSGPYHGLIFLEHIKCSTFPWLLYYVMVFCTYSIVLFYNKLGTDLHLVKIDWLTLLVLVGSNYNQIVHELEPMVNWWVKPGTRR